MASTRGTPLQNNIVATNPTASNLKTESHTHDGVGNPINSTGGRLHVDADLTVQSVTVDITGDHEDLDTGGGTDDHEVFAIGLPSAGGHVVGGTSTDPLRVDPTGSTTQPVSLASVPLPTGAATEATLAKAATDITAVLAATDKLVTFTWLSFGNSQERISTKVYTSASLSATVTDTYGYSEPLGSGNGFQLDTITRVLT